MQHTKYNITKFGTMQHNILRCKIQSTTIQYNILWYSILHYSIIQHTHKASLTSIERVRTAYNMFEDTRPPCAYMHAMCAPRAPHMRTMPPLWCGRRSPEGRRSSASHPRSPSYSASHPGATHGGRLASSAQDHGSRLSLHAVSVLLPPPMPSMIACIARSRSDAGACPSVCAPPASTSSWTIPSCTSLHAGHSAICNLTVFWLHHLLILHCNTITASSLDCWMGSQHFSRIVSWAAGRSDLSKTVLTSLPKTIQYNTIQCVTI